MLLMTRRTASALGLALLAGCGTNRPTAQAPAPSIERISLRGTPAPNQVIKIGMTQDLSFDVEIEGRPTGPMNVAGRTSFSATQRSGTPDAQGNLSVELTIDEMSANVNMNGQASPVSGSADSLKGKTITIIYDSQGKVLDIKAPGMAESLSGTMRGMMQSFAVGIPRAALGIGDSVTVPISIPLPLPLPGGPPGAALNLELTTTSRLVAVDRDGPDRLATLDQTMVATTNRTVEMPGPGGQVSVNLDMRMTGSGKMQLNVEKGFVKAGATDTKIEATMLMMGTTVRMTGTTHLVLTGSAQPK